MVCKKFFQQFISLKNNSLANKSFDNERNAAIYQTNLGTDSFPTQASLHSSPKDTPDSLENRLKLRLKFPPSVKIIIEEGSELDLDRLKDLRLPLLRTFKYIKYYKEQSKRWS